MTTWVAIDQHKLSLVAGILPASGGTPEVTRLENTERAIRRFIDKLGGPAGLAVCYEAGPGGYDLQRLLSRLGRDDLRRARTAARHRITKQLLRHGHNYRDGKELDCAPPGVDRRAAPR